VTADRRREVDDGEDRALDGGAPAVGRGARNMKPRTPPSVIDQLAAIPLFAGCGRAELGRIAQLGTIVARPDGTSLVGQDRLGAEFVVLVEGEARCAVDGTAVRRFGPGDFFGELALIDGGTRTAAVVSEGDVEVLVLDRREFVELFEISPAVAHNMLAEMARRLRSTTAQLRDRA
jgi:CRP-like cAMP-binding protein